jgi:hypothetical protein
MFFYSASTDPLGCGWAKPREAPSLTDSFQCEPCTLVKPAISADGSVDPSLAASILKIVQSCYQLDATDTIQEIEAFIEETIRSTDTNYKVAEAIVRADNFAWPKEAIEQDHQKFRSAKGDFPTTVSTAQAALASTRLSKERVMLLRPDNPDVARFLIAEGMTVPKPTGFVPNGSLSMIVIESTLRLTETQLRPWTRCFLRYMKSS